jgi:phage virion morphogenesis protein
MIGSQTFFADEAPAEMDVLAEGLDSQPLTPAMQECAVLMKQSVRDNFTSSATPDDENWPPRKDPGDGHPLLTESGALLQAAVGGGAGHLEEVGDREVAMGVDGSVIPYAATHNFGRDTGRGAPIPQREFAGLRIEHEEACEQVIEDFVFQELFG